MLTFLSLVMTNSAYRKERIFWAVMHQMLSQISFIMKAEKMITILQQC